MSNDIEVIEITIAALDRMRDAIFAPKRKTYPTEEKAAQIAHMRSSGESVVFVFRPDGSMIDDSHVAAVFGRLPLREQYLNLGDARAEHLHNQYQGFFGREFILSEHNINTDASISIPFYIIIDSTNAEVAVALVKDGNYDRQIERHAKEKNLPVFDNLDSLVEKILTDPGFKGKSFVFDQAGELAIDMEADIDRFDVIASDLNPIELANLKRAYRQVFGFDLDMSEIGVVEDRQSIQSHPLTVPDSFFDTGRTSGLTKPPSFGQDTVRLLSAPRHNYGFEKEEQTALVLQEGQFREVQYRAFESTPSDKDSRDTVWIGKRSELVRFTKAGDIQLLPYDDAANRCLVDLFSGKPAVVNSFVIAYSETFARALPMKSMAMVEGAYKGIVPQWSPS